MNPVVAKAYGLLLGAALAAAGLPVAPGGLTSRAVVSYGHQGAVRDMAADASRGLVFSAGEDGTLRIWDAVSQTLMRRIAVTRQSIVSVAVDPAASLAAILITDGARANWADVWNWDTGELLYRVPLDAAPLFAHFSLSGKYLLFGTMSWDSLRIYRALNGQPVSAPDEGGMVGFAEVSRSDATLMTYRLSGTIEYRDLGSGEIVKRVPAEPDLVNVRVSADRRYLVGHSSTEIAPGTPGCGCRPRG
jgi:WD40 repeat protein